MNPATKPDAVTQSPVPEAEMARELMKLTIERKAIEKREKELKDYFKKRFGIGSFDFAGVVVQVIARARTNLDIEAVRKFFGTETIKQFEKTISYEEVAVSEVKTIEVHPKALEGYLAQKRTKGEVS